MARDTSDIPPSLVFCGLRIYVDRADTRVTGRADFPYEAYARTSVPIDYSSRRPAATEPRPSGSGPLDSRDREGAASPIPDKARIRLELVERWRQLCRDHPEQTQTELARQVAASSLEIKCSPSSLRGWAKKLDIEGIEGLRDRYVKPPKKVPTFDPAHARDALLLCAWWSYRIGNLERIDTKMMSAAVGLIAAGYPIADLIATVDCYYSYKCDRDKYPFKPFERWVKYDLAKWIQRAASDADYIRALSKERSERTPLQTAGFTGSPRPASPPDPRTRRRDTRNRPTHQAIRKLANEPSAMSPQPSANRQSTIDNRQSARTAKWMSSLGHPHLARQLAASIDTGIPALVANEDPQTMAESLALLDDAYRVMLLRAARGDRDAHKQAAATLPLWWERMPQTIRNNIDFKIDHFRREHPGCPDAFLANRKLLMLLPHLRDHRSGTQRLAVAARLPA